MSGRGQRENEKSKQEGAAKLYQAQLGMPKNKRLLKLLNVYRLVCGALMLMVASLAENSWFTLYDPSLVSFNEMTGSGFDPRKARGFIDVQALHMWASERARHRTRQ